MWFPIGLGYVATALDRAGRSFEVLDLEVDRLSWQEIEEHFKNNQYDVVATGTLVSAYAQVKKLTGIIKKYQPESTIVCGNSVASSIPERLLDNTGVDIVVIGEGDITAVELLDALENKSDLDKVDGIVFKRDEKHIYTPRRTPIKDISSLPYINFDLFPVDKYLDNSPEQVLEAIPFPKSEARALPINTARGCFARCTFCYHVFKDVKYRFRSADSLANEIGHMIDKYNLNFIHFQDELTFFSKKQVEELADALIALNKEFYWFGTCRANLFQNDEDIRILEKLKKAGCLGLGYSLESASPEILKHMNKTITVEQFAKQTELIKKSGMDAWTSLVLGFPEETKETLAATYQACIDTGIYPSSGYLQPQPGSPIYEECLENGWITDEEEYIMAMGDRQDFMINLTKMSDQEFQDCVADWLRKCNDALNVGLDEDKLIKTGVYQHSKAEDESA
jgi:radical SAM superfamily enzyme YgiQ (UPF0313 family)